MLCPRALLSCQPYRSTFFNLIRVIEYHAIKKVGVFTLTKETGPRLYHVVVSAVADLGGASRHVDTEDVAMRCHELAPALFSWRKYPEQVNLEIVRVSLSDAKKPKNGGLLAGSGRTGWRLTKRGLDWVSSASSPMPDARAAHPVSRRTAGSIDTVRIARERARIEASPAWASWKRQSPISLEQAKELFRIDSYTSGELADIKITRLSSVFEIDSEHRQFLDEASCVLRKLGKDHA